MAETSDAVATVEATSKPTESEVWWKTAIPHLLTARTAIVAAAVICVIIVLGYVAPFAPFSTTGNVYVSSPEVYTRERLVNDRYDQDYWYKKNLIALDSATIDVAVRTTTSFSGKVGSGTTEGANGASASTESSGATRDIAVPFDVAFDARSTVRDTIRQLILENMLDDRHDLTGNSIYGLKFDTTVVAGDNTHARASVQISASIPHPFPSDIPADPDDLPKMVEAVFRSDTRLAVEGPGVRDAYNLYQAWIGSVISRLNTYASRVTVERAATGQLCSDTDASADADRTTLTALGAVLGIDMDFDDLRSPKDTEGMNEYLKLPLPWPKFLSVSRSGGKSCSDKLVFNARDVWDYVYLFDVKTGIPKELTTKYVDLASRNNNWIAAVPNRGANQGITLTQYPISGEMVDMAVEAGRAFQVCVDKFEQGEACTKAYQMLVPSGLFNFVAEASKSDAYVYALFPKSETRVIAREQNTGAAGETSGGFIDGVLSFGQSRSEVGNEISLVGYGDSKANLGDHKAATEVKFGWVVGPVQSASQGTQLVLLSVPAWSDELVLTVSVGWLDRDGNHKPSREPYEMTIKLPPDYEAFDSFIAGEQGKQAPKILEEFMDNGPVQACSSASILIPGSRLWRSTTVTLGSQRADRIIVLPNMQGIVAEFNTIEVPAYAKVGEAVGLRLRVWTSEGEASAMKTISVLTRDEHVKVGSCPLAGQTSPVASIN